MSVLFLFNSFVTDEVQKFCFLRLFTFLLLSFRNFGSSECFEEWGWGSPRCWAAREGILLWGGCLTIGSSARIYRVIR